RDSEILTARLMDRPLRPLFPEGFKKDTQVIATVMSSDRSNPTDVLAMIGASAALHLSDIPWAGPIAGVRVALIEGEFVAYPTVEEVRGAGAELTVAVTKSARGMVGGGAKKASETKITDALGFAHREGKKVMGLTEKIRSAVGKPKREFSMAKRDEPVAK